VKGSCAINGCAGTPTRKGMCQKHYRRQHVHGDPLKTNRRSNADGNGYRQKVHVMIAEKAIGRPLPRGALVHHVNEDKSDNTPSNLVICPSTEYHALLHIRMRALAAVGNANARKCKICRQYGLPGEVTVISNGTVYHPQCNREHVARYAKAKREATCL